MRDSGDNADCGCDNIIAREGDRVWSKRRKCTRGGVQAVACRLQNMITEAVAEIADASHPWVWQTKSSNNVKSVFLNASLLITWIRMMVTQARKEPEGISCDYHLVHFLDCRGTHLNHVSHWPVQLQFMFSHSRSQDSSCHLFSLLLWLGFFFPLSLCASILSLKSCCHKNYWS